MIKASALLAAVAIGLLVAGVLASSLLMVYISIGVCAVAALILVAGILTHWSEISGRGEARPASVQGAWSAPQARVSSLPVLASPVPTAVAGREERRARNENSGGPPAGEQAAAGPQQEFHVTGRADDLWQRVEEELGSAGKRDTGALSWPATEVPAFREDPGSTGQAAPPGEAGPRDTSPAGSSAWIWGRGAGWQPPETSDPAWPPPAAAFAGPSARPEPAQDADDTALEDTAPEDTGPDDTGPDATRSAHAEPVAQPASKVAGAGPAQGADQASSPDPDATPGAPDGTAAPGSQDDEESAEPASEPGPPRADTGQDRPQWIVSLPRREDPAMEEPASEAAAGETDGPAKPGPPAKAAAATGDSAASEPAAEGPAAGKPEAAAAQDSAAQNSAASEPAAGGPAAGEPAGGEPAAGGGLAAGGHAAAEPGEPTAAPSAGSGRAEVTVVPGVARYHRSGCILIRFLGADDVEIMTRQEAEEATLVPCRACQPDQLEA